MQKETGDAVVGAVRKPGEPSGTLHCTPSRCRAESGVLVGQGEIWAVLQVQESRGWAEGEREHAEAGGLLPSSVR